MVCKDASWQYAPMSRNTDNYCDCWKSGARKHPLHIIAFGTKLSTAELCREATSVMAVRHCWIAETTHGSMLL